MTGRRTVYLASGAMSRAMSAIATTVISASTPAAMPRGTAASICQSWYSYAGNS